MVGKSDFLRRRTAALTGPPPVPVPAADRRRALACLALVASCALAGCAGFSRSEGTRAPDVHYDPTPDSIVAQMVALAKVGPNDLVYDLGCGDGRTVIAAVKAGARGVCVDIDPQRIRESRANAAAAGVSARIRFLEQDLFTTDFRDASVVILFLWPDLNLKLRPQLMRDLRPGTRVLSYVHDMGDWKPRQTLRVQGAHGERNLHLWIIAAAAR